MYAKLVSSALLALAPLAALSAQTGGENGSGAGEAVQTITERAPESQRRERQMCRRIGLTGQPTSMRRVCKTAAEWREIDESE
ncbi:MAG TPA: hypothetical protein VEW25_00990 [Allosphingosinicella sp.]|nr:hypothetical protein [Allosphingosinicella sp.]